MSPRTARPTAPARPSRTSRSPRRRTVRVGPFTPPEDAARAAKLRHVNDGEPGITRSGSANAVTYTGPDGKTVRDDATLARIRSLAIPPAWTDVWICTDAQGHLQATGRDARGRKQYRYHPAWRLVRDETKYGRAVLFGESLADMRKKVERDLARPGLSRERVLATIVRLLERTFIRVGNTEYARSNKSFGLTTLLDRHVQIAGATVVFKFRGKSGKTHDIRLTDKRLATLVRKCRDVPGQDLFQYIDDAGERHAVRSNDVNEYLRSISDSDFTAKDFRTWAGTLLAAAALLEAHTTGTKLTKAATLRAVETVAAQLGNTPAVCRKCYIHPAILRSFEDEALLGRFVEAFSGQRTLAGLSGAEGALLQFLKSTNST